MKWTCTETDGNITFSLARAKDDKGLYKAYAVGPGGKCLLGTLTPHFNELTLRKTLPKAALLRCGAWPVQRLECCLSFPFHPADAPCPSDLFSGDPLLRRCFCSSPAPRYALLPSGFSLSYPFRCHCPFPMTPLFCFAQVTSQMEDPVLTFFFSPSGQPVMPPAPQAK